MVLFGYDFNIGNHKMKRFNVECGRCLGTGRFDRGTCFECKGNRFVLKTRKPKTEPRNFVVTFDNGKTNEIKMYFFLKEYALKAVEYQLIVRGWKGTISQV